MLYWFEESQVVLARREVRQLPKVVKKKYIFLFHLVYFIDFSFLKCINVIHFNFFLEPFFFAFDLPYGVHAHVPYDKSLAENEWRLLKQFVRALLSVCKGFCLNLNYLNLAIAQFVISTQDFTGKWFSCFWVKTHSIFATHVFQSVVESFVLILPAS